MINPVLLLSLVSVMCFAAWSILSNPDRELSTESYWHDAVLTDVYEIPQDALEVGNKNGAVLMWASSVTDDPEVVTALIQRGADVNEQDPIFSGTPLGAAASQSTSPDVIVALVEHGAILDMRLANGFTALMNAAQWNKDARIALELINQGADPLLTNDLGKTALQIAIEENNTPVISVLENHLAELQID